MASIVCLIFTYFYICIHLSGEKFGDSLQKSWFGEKISLDQIQIKCIQKHIFVFQKNKYFRLECKGLLLFFCFFSNQSEQLPFLVIFYPELYFWYTSIFGETNILKVSKKNEKVNKSIVSCPYLSLLLLNYLPYSIIWKCVFEL